MIIYNIEKKTLVIPQGFSESSTSQEDYERGVSDGKAQQKALLSATTIIDNGTFTREDGWSAVTVDVPQDARLTTLSVIPQPSSLDERKWVSYAVSSMTGYDGWDIVNVNMTSILEEGARQQKEKLSATTITDNGTYRRNDGWSAVTVNVTSPSLSSTAFTENGTYTNANGWSSVTVNTRIQGTMSGTFYQETDIPAYYLIYPADGYSTQNFHWEYIEIDGVMLQTGNEIIPAGIHTFKCHFGTTELSPFQCSVPFTGSFIVNF